MCCLKYEQNAYENLIRITPKVGAYVSTSEGKGTVTEISLLTGLGQGPVGQGQRRRADDL